MFKTTFLPVLTSQAGSCLTLENWQQAGIRHGVYDLQALIIKPGLQVLREFKNLRHYTGWPGTIVLNARLKPDPKTCAYKIRSPYDGQMIKLSPAELLAFIEHLQPDYVIWPADMEPLRVQCSVLQVGQNSVDDHPMFYCLDDERLESEEMTSAQVESDLPVWLESDKPAADAIEGQIYQQQGVFNLLDLQYREAFVLLEDACRCVTCRAGYTRAYLHHLLQQTPLLAQRWLILHNVHCSLVKLGACHLPPSEISL